MVGIEKLEKPAEIAEVRAMIESTSPTPRARAPGRSSTVGPDGAEVRQGHAEGLQAHARLHRPRPGQGLTGDEAIMAAFEENARDLSRVGGN
jgi:glutamate synthase (NADPH/NADH) large chain